MRTRVVSTALLIAALLIATALFLRREDGAAPRAEESVAAQSTHHPLQPTPTVVHPTLQAPVVDRQNFPLRETPDDAGQVEHDTMIANRVAGLHRLAMTSDPESLSTILAALNDEDPEVRRAAVSATVDFGSQDAIPSLQETLDRADDPTERADLQRAIDLLKLPSVLDPKQ